MATRTIDGPGRPEKSFCTTAEAAEWLNVGESTFLRWVGHKKDGTPIAEWIKPYGHGDKLLWDVWDVIALRQMVMKRAAEAAATPESDKKS